MNIDGRKIAEDLFASVRKDILSLGQSPHLTVFTCAPNFETQKFLALKRQKAQLVGVNLDVVEFDPATTTEECVVSIRQMIGKTDGVIVQLPFPSHFDQTDLIAAIPVTHDVDAFHGGSDTVLPPVVGAIKAIIDTEHIAVAGKNVAVIGNGALVGAPAAKWLQNHGALVTVLTKADTDLSAVTKEADIIVLGAGVPGLLKPDMINTTAVVFDAGTSEAAGELRGDADPACSEVAALFTPVPGGIGPITIAALFQNLVTLMHEAE